MADISDGTLRLIRRLIHYELATGSNEFAWRASRAWQVTQRSLRRLQLEPVDFLSVAQRRLLRGEARHWTAMKVDIHLDTLRVRKAHIGNGRVFDFEYSIITGQNKPYKWPHRAGLEIDLAHPGASKVIPILDIESGQFYDHEGAFHQGIPKKDSAFYDEDRWTTRTGGLSQILASVRKTEVASQHHALLVPAVHALNRKIGLGDTLLVRAHSVPTARYLVDTINGSTLKAAQVPLTQALHWATMPEHAVTANRHFLARVLQEARSRYATLNGIYQRSIEYPSKSLAYEERPHGLRLYEAVSNNLHETPSKLPPPEEVLKYGKRATLPYSQFGYGMHPTRETIFNFNDSPLNKKAIIHFELVSRTA